MLATYPSPAANSLTSLEWADAYIGVQLYPEAWLAAEQPKREAALITATRALARLPWGGWKVFAAQPLPFPRYGLMDPDTFFAVPPNIIPDRIQAACAEAGRVLLEAGQLPSARSETAGLKHFKAGPVELEWEASSLPDLPWLPEHVMELVRPWLGGQYYGGGVAVPLVRS